jgi:two-component system sensor histidine kinase RegB
LLAFVLLAVLLAYFITKLVQLLEAQSLELENLRQRSANEQKLIALTTLSAGAAHELGSPLASISVATHETAYALQQFPEAFETVHEDLQLVSEQLERCQKILRAMGTQSGEFIGEVLVDCPIASLMDDLRARMNDTRIHAVKIDVEHAPVSVQTYREALLSSLISLLKNALDASEDGKSVLLNCHQRGKHLIFRVIDQGVGMSSSVLSRFGEPFFTTKPEGKGMGLGVFLVKLFTHRIGGEFSAQSTPGKGTQVEISIPL